MRIGTVTFWNSEENYGQVLQCFSLLKCLKDLGHESFLIKTQETPSRTSVIHKFFTFVDLLFSAEKRRLLRYSHKGVPIVRVVDRKFLEFKKKHIASTDKVYTYNELKCNPLHLEAIVCGSDQIWSTPSPLMFLNFADSRIKKIAYAASFGGYSPSNIVDRIRIRNYLKKFQQISVREKKGKLLCNDLGRDDASCVPDPTLLLPCDTYRNLESLCGDISRPFILVYMLGNKTNFNIDEVLKYAEKTDLDVKYVASQGRNDDYGKYYPTIEEWLWLMDHAEFVVTNSFHGTVFSLIFNTPFLTIPLVDEFQRMNDRIFELLDRYDLKERITEQFAPSFTEKNVDFTVFNKSIVDERREAIAFLQKGLNNNDN